MNIKHFNHIRMTKSSMLELSWDLHSTHFQGLLGHQLVLGDHNDVTLVSHDKKTIKAHQMVLSAMSPVFDNLLKESKDPSPFIYLEDISHQQMEAVVQFIYLGKITMDKDKVNSFTKLATQLQVRGTENSDDIKSWASKSPIKSSIKQESHNDADVEEVPQYVPSIQLEEDIDDPDSVVYACDKCQFESCDDKMLRQHISQDHAPPKFPCNKCSFKTTNKDNLNEHVKSMHEAANYLCDKCDYKATENAILIKHLEDVHDGSGVQYKCQKCKFEGTSAANLRSHNRITHEGRTYYCRKRGCNFQTKWYSNYMHHNRSEHPSPV